MATESGFSSQKKLGTAQFKTIHNVGGDKFGQSVASKALYEKTAPDYISISDVIGNSGQIEFLNIYYPGHSASINDVLRLNGGLYPNFEFDIVSIVDADNFLVLPLLPAIDISGELALIMSWVTNKANADGSQIVTLAPVPLQFVKDSTVINVNEDTVTPANNSALPANNFFKLDGVDTPVSKDSAIPANTIALPVEDVNVLDAVTTLGLLVQNVDTGPGTSAGVPVFALDTSINEFKYLNVDPNNALKVSAADLPLPSGAATEAKQDTGNSSLASIDGKFTTLNAKDFATSAKQDTGNASLSSVDSKLQDNGVVDAGNSSVTPLGISGVFTGAAFEITKYAAINVNVRSDVASATNGLKVEFSPDGTNWDHSHQTTYSGGNGVGYIFNAEYKFARVVYTNSTVAQTSFRLQTIFKTTLTTSSLYTLSQTVNANMFAALNRSVIAGETTGGGGGYVNVKVNPSGALTVEATVSGVSTLAEQQTQTTAIGSLTETAPATDTASSGLNGRLQRIAQRLTSLIALFPSSIGTKASAASLSVVLASDQAAIGVTPGTSSGAITQVQKVVGTSAVRATVAGTAPSATRKRLLIKPSKNNTGSIYLGASSVTNGTGLEIIGPDRLEFLLDASDYYLISDTAAQVVEIIEVV